MIQQKHSYRTQEGNTLKWAFVAGGGIRSFAFCLSAYFHLKFETFIIHTKDGQKQISEKTTRKEAPDLYWFEFLKRLFLADLCLFASVMAARK